MQCPVCGTDTCLFFMTVGRQDYWRCRICVATFLDPVQLPTAETELARYGLHQNDAEAPGYRKFLNRLAVPLFRRMPSAQKGLDYGCGPGSGLATIFREAGHSVALFDPFFQPDQGVLSFSYDFITCSEVVEHFHRPAYEFERLDSLLKPGGWLALMTCFQKDDSRFSEWYYRRDPTHVVFYREETLRHIARRLGWFCEIPVKDVALLQKPK